MCLCVCVCVGGGGILGLFLKKNIILTFLSNCATIMFREMAVFIGPVKKK